MQKNVLLIALFLSLGWGLAGSSWGRDRAGGQGGEEGADYYKSVAKNFHEKLSVRNKVHSQVLAKVKSDFHKFNEAFVIDEGIIKASSVPKRNPTAKQVVFLHFHKAGGTSICRYFKDSGTWRVPEKFCICNEKVTTHALLAHTRKVVRLRNLDKMFQKSQADICMLEKKWIRPYYFFQIRQLFQGSFVTSLRAPWDRFRSNYEKDFSICSDQYQRKSKLNRMTIETYSQLNPRDCPKSYYLRTNTNRPNFYIRMLNGLSIEQYSFDGDGEGGLKVMTRTHLEQAKEVLLAFDVILFLEEAQESQNQKMQRLTGSNLNLTQRSNNPFSEAHGRISNKTKLDYKVKRREVLDRDILPAFDHFKAQFEIENKLDIELYQWAFDRFSNKVQ